MNKPSLALIAISLIALSGASASAQPNPDEVAIKVSYNGLDINTASGAKVLLRRIEQAATAVCGGEPANRLDRMKTFRPCTKEVVNRTVSKIDSPALTALLRDRTATAMVQQLAGK
ncbi:MAG: UrcA family protein [Phenylobacterium sp.]|uniref:UrcA family protein n=1 Tax=Phenylobacterium sp. TaxID=1871053 RepID=UPI0025D0B109|nr:UrcA family protein [Phenylobacterium sp.]MCA3712799.1 UrcA family protein [Phenylobacterium sp.]MCA3725729.1 UrcA family protein [Phenylobacterium sp.]MCA3731909.1 UrcA family protein [Phenylobacterium sp.]MCA3752083.1 UrcA family protein [Phenylobacterium sp.]MCA3757048.1 UrcA family protein [Phenylobacterium sp.]